MPAHDFELSSAFLIHDTARLIRRRFDGSIRDLGLTEAKWRLLIWLRRAPGLRQSELADRLGIEKAPLGLALDWLEQAGWIRRETDPADRRARRVFLQAQAEPTLRLMDERFRQVEFNYLRGFDESELGELLEDLQVLRDHLRPKNSDGSARADARPETYLTVLFECARLLIRRFDARLAEIGFTRHQWLVMNTVERREGVRQTELAEAVDLGTAAIGKLVDALQASGWLERRVDARDRRANHLYLTRRARHMLASTRERFESLHAELTRALGATRQHSFVNRLGWIRHRLLEETAHIAEARRAGGR